MTSAQKLIVVVALVVCIGAALHQARQASRLAQEVRRLRADQQPLANQVAALQKERDEVAARLAQAQRDLARAQTNTSELLRLRGQVAVLRQQLQSAGGKPRSAQPSAPGPVEAPPELATRTLQTQVIIPAGHTLALGGMASAHGKQTITFVTTTVEAGNGEKAQVLIQSKLIEAPEEAWQQVGLGGILGGANAEPQTGLLTAAETQKLIQKLTEMPGVDVLSAPAVTTQDGRAAAIAVGNQPPPGATNAPGINLDLVPNLTPDGQSVNLGLTLKLTTKTQ
jgi:hypothetical protein